MLEVAGEAADSVPPKLTLFVAAAMRDDDEQSCPRSAAEETDTNVDQTERHATGSAAHFSRTLRVRCR
jgi:hypothetical protein